MMQLHSLECSHPQRGLGNVLPAEVTRDIHQLAWKVASCCQDATDQREVIVVIRQRPINARGKTGCRAEIISSNRRLEEGLQPVLQQNLQRNQSQRAAATTVLNMERLIMGGWKITLDAEWAC